MKDDSLFKRSFNQTLDDLTIRAIRDLLGSENALKERLAVSRTTVRKVLRLLEARRIVVLAPGGWIIVRHPTDRDYFPRAETVSTSARVEKKFMEWMLRVDRKPGDDVNGLELARQFGVSTGAIREYLNRFSRFGLIERRPNAAWTFRGFTIEFALELFEIRELFELRSAGAFGRQRSDSVAWPELRKLEREHRSLLGRIARDYHDFSDLDERFHRLICDASRNRFIADFYELISLIFHYHYQWNKTDEKQRNRVAVTEHLDCIAALFSGDPRRIDETFRLHLSSARQTLLSSLGHAPPRSA